MSVIDLVTRADAICKKYEKFDVAKQREDNVSGDDPFSRIYSDVESETQAAFQKFEAAASETSRARAVALNAEIRRTKARLLEEIPKLQRLAYKKVKGISKEDRESRAELVSTLRERIDEIPDGSASAAWQTSAGGMATMSHTPIKFDAPSDGRFGNEYFQETQESERFRQEYEMKKLNQDRGLDEISAGLDTLKDMAHDINEEMDRQRPLVDEIDNKVDRTTFDLKTTNARLKDTVNRMRSSRNFCIDIILLCVILGIAAYLYNVLK